MLDPILCVAHPHLHAQHYPKRVVTFSSGQVRDYVFAANPQEYGYMHKGFCTTSTDARPCPTTPPSRMLSASGFRKKSGGMSFARAAGSCRSSADPSAKAGKWPQRTYIKQPLATRAQQVLMGAAPDKRRRFPHVS